MQFHYAFLVTDLQATRRFYAEVLGCVEGRSTDEWADFDFFGNQLSAHLTTQASATITAQVDSHSVPLPHFGAILPWMDFDSLAERLHSAGCAFVIEPTLRFAGEAGEQKTMFLLDPSGNALEFKSFRREHEVFTRQTR